MRHLPSTSLALLLLVPPTSVWAAEGNRGTKDVWDILQALGPIIGFAGLLIAAVVAYWLNRRQRRWEIDEERRRLASALAGEIQHLLSDVNSTTKERNKIETAIRDLEQQKRDVNLGELFVESSNFEYTVVFDGNVGKLGLLDRELSYSVAHFYAAYKSYLDNIHDASNKKYHDDLAGCARSLHRALELAEELSRYQNSLNDLKKIAS